MAYYTIDRPGNKKGDVHKGKAYLKKSWFVKLWPWIKISSKVGTGYLVTIEDELRKNRNEYHYYTCC